MAESIKDESMKMVHIFFMIDLFYNPMFAMQTSGGLSPVGLIHFFKKAFSGRCRQFPEMQRQRNRRCIYIFFIIFLLSTPFSYTQLNDFTAPNVFIQDMNNRLIEQVKVQSPFMLQLEFDDSYEGYEIKHIPGMESFKHSPGEKNIISSTYNEKPFYKNIYKFILKSEKKGNYSVGPFILKNKIGRSIKIPRIVIIVGDQTIVSSTKVDAEKYIVTAELLKSSVYIGEKVTAHIKFFDRVFVEKSYVMLPDFKNITILNVEKKSTTSIESIDDYDYIVTQWDIELYPQEEGQLKLDDIKIKFLDQKLEETSLSKGVFRRFGSMLKVERELAVPSLSLDVKSLPKKGRFYNVQAVGQFSKLMISVNKSNVLQGQGLVLTTKLYGIGNFEMIDIGKLVLPESFQYYDANTIKIDENRTYKQSEFIVQANEAGDYQILPQLIHYFDPIDNRYKILQSNSIDITVMPDLQAQEKKDMKTHAKCNEDDFSQIDTDKTIIDYNALDQRSLSKFVTTMIPLALYKFCVYLLLSFLMMMLLYTYIVKKYVFSHQTWQTYYIFLWAHKACRHAKSKNNVGALYSIFLNLFIALHVATASIMSEEVIEKYLKDHNYSEEEIMQWRLFYSKLLQVSFAQDDQLDSGVLFRESFVWLQKLKEKI